ncbi:MAG: DUF4450 domain-containing protein [Bacteroidetes bacterium]|nr:DUF4450 domain-containing protein [Bacteroidota bacterium]
MKEKNSLALNGILVNDYNFHQRKSIFRNMTLVRLFIVLFILCNYILTEGQTGLRQIRYLPEGDDFVITNGQLKFNRAIYGTNSAFRLEAGDLPEFAFYMPGMGGNVKLALVNGDKGIWLTEAKQIETHYRSGSLIYKISDPVLDKGQLLLTVLAMNDEEGVILKADFSNIPMGCKLLIVYGGASNIMFRRDGERNVDPDDSFFLKANNCTGNDYRINKNSFSLVYGANGLLSKDEYSAISNALANGKMIKMKSDYKMMIGTFPENSILGIRDANDVNTPVGLIKSQNMVTFPIVIGEVKLKSEQTQYFSFHNPQKRQFLNEIQLVSLFEQAEKSRVELANRFVMDTPDKYINTIGGALSVAGDAIWEEPSYLHGAISWRVRIPGWRASYIADVLGWNDRAETHFSAYSNSQLVAPLSGSVEMDTTAHLARAKQRIGNAMYSSGYICPLPNHPVLSDLSYYDMNMVFIDALIRHFNWTGDKTYLKKVWPTIERHLDWEKRTFDADGDGLYDAYCCIWASDALYYNGGGVTHSSAYNYYANLHAAELAMILGKDSKPYRKEADKIRNAINRKLWLKDSGWYAEFVDALGNKALHPSAALWTVYHSIDSKIADQFQEYQLLRYIDTSIPHIPFKIKGMEGENYHMVATTNWMPYAWSTNNVATAEQMHTSLAYWQGGRPEEAFNLLKSSVMDVMYCGSSPGNFPMTSIYNAASRIEVYRDFADVIGISSRALVEGLFGIQPDLMHNNMIIKPGFPAIWEHASVRLPYIDFIYRFEAGKSKYTIRQKGTKQTKIQLQIPAKTDQINNILVNGVKGDYTVIENVGRTLVEIKLPAVKENNVTIIWGRNLFETKPEEVVAVLNEKIPILLKGEILDIKDPQGIIVEKDINGSLLQLKLNGRTGERTLFAKIKKGQMIWWQPINISLKDAVEIVAGDLEDDKKLNLYVRNNSAHPIYGKLLVGKNSGNPYVQTLKIASGSISELIVIPTNSVVKGTNNVEFIAENGAEYLAQLVNWKLPLNNRAKFEQVNMLSFFNDKITQIFRNKYLSPRSPYNTLQIPTQGIGDWCQPLRSAVIDDSGFRLRANNDLFITPFGLSFSTPQNGEKPNIAFTSLWDNYPDSVSVPLNGNASHAYFLMAGSSNQMQSRFENGTITIKYKDGSQSVLHLINPETWAPIERDYFTDEYSFSMHQPRPPRVVLQTGLVSRNFENVIKDKELDKRFLDGGGAIILDMPLDYSKELKGLTLKTMANEVVIGLMGVTLDRN